MRMAARLLLSSMWTSVMRRGNPPVAAGGTRVILGVLSVPGYRLLNPLVEGKPRLVAQLALRLLDTEIQVEEQELVLGLRHPRLFAFADRPPRLETQEANRQPGQPQGQALVRVRQFQPVGEGFEEPLL